jgi:phage recombination protein Bet
MTTAVVKNDNEIVITNEQRELIRQTVCKDATPSEMELYFYDCQRRGVHPLDRLIHFSKRYDKNGIGRYTPITGIDFLYMKAHATGEFAGQDETQYQGEPGNQSFSATVRVYRQKSGMDKAGWTATARWSEYFPGEKQGFMWQKMPHRMLEKCAEALALRKAFAAELHGLYVKEEMDQAGSETPPETPPAQVEIAPSKGASVLDKMKTQNKAEPERVSGTPATAPLSKEPRAALTTSERSAGSGESNWNEYLSESDWIDCVTYLNDDPDRLAIGKICLAKFHAKVTKDIPVGRRKEFLLTVQDELRRRQIPFETMIYEERALNNRTGNGG